MQESKIEILDKISLLFDTIQPQKIFFAGFGAPPPGQVQTVPFDRFILPLAGCKKISASINDEVCKLNLYEGDILYCPGHAWVKQDWKSDHEMISIVFNWECIRSLYINHKGNIDFPPPVFFHHTDKTINPAGRMLLHSLDEMNNDPKWQEPALVIFKALIQLTVQEIKESAKFEENKARLTWRKVSGYLTEHATENIGRDQVALHFDLHPSYVSRLFKRFSGMTFQHYFDEIRMQLAEKLLHQQHLTIQNIAQQCGYNSSSYFIRTFRKYYDMSPGQFRQT